MAVEDRLAKLGITLPQAAAPVASYVPVVVTGNMAFVSGQLPFVYGQVMVGRLGDDVSVEQGAAAARACGLMIIAQLVSAGLADRVDRIVKLGAFVTSTADFTDQPKVANGASDLMSEIFGDAGTHARAAVGVPSLPLGACVEVDAIITLKD
ncbi:RidA family protein [Aurantiacibacter sp. D1-12]|uniref:RidA family protein n=1 Tax=Aurantiacibacter sp. D1-12 TaxID=2993658 RepID=UPI00237D0A2B|nr:RidA family protein [Aurantiacibacter sp. D1-12]MDE1468563.1 RidA family protein [Aurantiacibacter sp. D1-12]